MIKNGIKVDGIYQDIASGMNENRIQFNDLLEKIINREIQTVYITYKDRLTRFGFNYRLVNGRWDRGRIVNNLRKRCGLNGIELIEVNAAYSSFVGNVNYGDDHTPDQVASSIEIARRGYKKYDKGWFYPVKKNIENLKKLWKQDLDWNSLSWKELFNLSKESKLKYRFSLIRKEFFRLFSYKSNIILYSFL
jgi:hypothetical protein